MARRHDYISFFGEGRRRRRRREFTGFEPRPGIFRILLPLLGVAVIGVSLWWFAWRDADKDVGAVITLEDATIPTLLLPAGAETDPALAGSDTFECPQEIEEWSTFQGGTARTGCASTAVITDPRILWRAEVGVMGWLNNPIVVGNSVYVSSAGVTQFVPDRRDAIYSLDLGTGRQNWYYQAELDVNGIGYLNGVVVATGDEGRVWGLDARDGTPLWTHDLEAPTYSNPLTIDGMAIVGDGDGVVTAFDIRSGAVRWQREVDGAVRGGAASDGEMIVVVGENHDVLALDMSGNLLWRVAARARGTSADLAKVFAAPTITDDMIIISLVRAGVYAEPALVALDKANGEVLWRGIDVAGIKRGDWANIRSSVSVAGDFVVFGEALSNVLVGIDLETGQTRWSTTIGSYCLPHWPSPAITSGQAILPRDDGGLYAVDMNSHQLVWSIYLGNSSTQSGGTFPAGFDEEFCESDEAGYGILSSPAVAPNGVVLVGTLEGWLYAIGDRSWG